MSSGATWHWHLALLQRVTVAVAYLHNLQTCSTPRSACCAQPPAQRAPTRQANTSPKLGIVACGVFARCVLVPVDREGLWLRHVGSAGAARRKSRSGRRRSTTTTRFWASEMTAGSPQRLRYRKVCLRLRCRPLGRGVASYRALCINTLLTRFVFPMVVSLAFSFVRVGGATAHGVAACGLEKLSCGSNSACSVSEEGA